MPSGHSFQTVELIRAEHKRAPTNPVFTLAFTCIKHNIPFAVAAADLGVTKQTFYNWLYGKYAPRTDMIPKITKLAAQLKKQNEKV